MPRQFPSRVFRTAVCVGIYLLRGSLFANPPTATRGDQVVDVPAMLRQVESLRVQGSYGKAIDAAKSALRMSEKAFGHEDPRTTTAKSALAAAYLEVGNGDAAVPLLRSALAELERAEPRDMSAIGCVVGDLAQSVADTAEAESLYRRALAIAEQAHGPEHRATGHALNNMAAFLREQGRYDEAEHAMRNALHIRERTEGMASPLTAQSLCTLGRIAADRGDFSVAESLVRGSLARRQAILPARHPDLAESSYELARILLVVGNDSADEAMKLASEALTSYKAAFGPTHARTLLAMHAKADALAALGRHKESEIVHRDLIAAIETLPSSQGDVLAEALREFSQHLVEAGKPGRAVELCRRAIALRQQSHGRGGAGVVDTMQVLAEALYANGQFDEAVTEGREVLSLLEDGGGDRPLDMAIARGALAKYLLAEGEIEEARSLLRQALTMFEQTTGRGSPQTLQAVFRLAVTYVGTGELGEAERIVDDGLKRFSDAKDVRTGGAAADLVGLRAVIYRQTGRDKEADEAEAAVKQAHAGEKR